MSPQSNPTPDQIAAIEAIRLAFFAENGKAEPKPIIPQRADKFKRGDKVRVKPIGVEATGAILHVFEMVGQNVHVGESAEATHGPWYSEEELELAPVDPLAEVKAAHERGEVVQAKLKDTAGYGWVNSYYPTWDDSYLWRVKPWTLPVPPEGREYHRNDWTQEMLPPGTRPLLKGESVEEGDELQCGDGWVPQQVHGKPVKYSCWMDNARIRTRRPLTDPQREAFDTWWSSLDEPTRNTTNQLIAIGVWRAATQAASKQAALERA